MEERIKELESEVSNLKEDLISVTNMLIHVRALVSQVMGEGYELYSDDCSELRMVVDALQSK